MTLIPKTYDFSELLGAGENPNGMVAQTPNGTVINGRGGDGDSFSFGPQADGPRWNADPRPEAPDLIEPGVVQVAGHRRRKRG